MSLPKIIYCPDAEKDYSIGDVTNDFPKFKDFFSWPEIKKIDEVYVFNVNDGKEIDLGIMIKMKKISKDKVGRHRILKHTYYTYHILTSENVIIPFHQIVSINKFKKKSKETKISEDDTTESSAQLLDENLKDVNKNSKVCALPKYLKMGRENSTDSIHVKLYQPKPVWEDNTYYFDIHCYTKK